jgi:hypothetical protein
MMPAILHIILVDWAVDWAVSGEYNFFNLFDTV